MKCDYNIPVSARIISVNNFMRIKMVARATCCVNSLNGSDFKFYISISSIGKPSERVRNWNCALVVLGELSF